MRKTQVRALGGEDTLEKEMAIHSSTIAWKIPWTEEGLRYAGGQVSYDEYSKRTFQRYPKIK